MASRSQRSLGATLEATYHKEEVNITINKQIFTTLLIYLMIGIKHSECIYFNVIIPLLVAVTPKVLNPITNCPSLML